MESSTVDDGQHANLRYKHMEQLEYQALLIFIVLASSFYSFLLFGLPIAVSKPSSVSNLRAEAIALTLPPEINSIPEPATVPWPSDRWRPARLTKCEGLSTQSAPCIKARHNHSNLVKAEELIYPAFRLHLPTYINSSQESWWVKSLSTLDRARVSTDKQWADYPIQVGQNLVFQNAAYKGDPPADVWSLKACMEKASSHLDFFDPITMTSNLEDTLVIATSPDSWSFQHFLDRVTVVWSQALLIEPTATTIVSGRNPSSTLVSEIYKEMGVQKHLHSQTNIAAKTLVFSCRAPLIHPFTTQRLPDMLHLDRYSTPMADRKIVLYASRSHGGAENGGRRILNEKVLLKGIRALLKKRNQGEKLVLFNPNEYPSLPELMNFMSTKVRAMIGPHGGAFYNARFASIHTLVLEFMPSERFAPCFWEQSRLSQQHYVSLMLLSTNFDNDMRIPDITPVIKTLDSELGKQNMSVPLSDDYPWETGEE